MTGQSQQNNFDDLDDQTEVAQRFTNAPNQSHSDVDHTAQGGFYDDDDDVTETAHRFMPLVPESASGRVEGVTGDPDDDEFERTEVRSATFAGLLLSDDVTEADDFTELADRDRTHPTGPINIAQSRLQPANSGSLTNTTMTRQDAVRTLPPIRSSSPRSKTGQTKIRSSAPLRNGGNLRDRLPEYCEPWVAPARVRSPEYQGRPVEKPSRFGLFKALVVLLLISALGVATYLYLTRPEAVEGTPSEDPTAVISDDD